MRGALIGVIRLTAGTTGGGAVGMAAVRGVVRAFCGDRGAAGFVVWSGGGAIPVLTLEVSEAVPCPVCTIDGLGMGGEGEPPEALGRVDAN